MRQQQQMMAGDIGLQLQTGAAQREDASRQRRDAATAGIFTGIGNVASGVASSAFTMGMGK